MFIGRPLLVFQSKKGWNRGLPKFPLKVTFASKLALGVTVVLFLLGYQPALQYPPIQPTRASAEAQEQVATITSQSLPFAFQMPHPGYISTYYSSYHPAIDIATGLGMPIKPVAKGTVTDASYNVWGLGLTVIVDHGSGYKSSYSHMGRMYVQKGQLVSENDLLGEVGMTGNTSGPHTHLEVFKDGKTINPLTILPKLPDISAAHTMGGVPQAPTTALTPATGSAVQAKWSPTPRPTITPEPVKTISKIDFSKQLQVSL